MTLEVIVPWRAGCPHREAAWRWVRARWSLLGWPLTIAEAPPGPWCKAAAVMPAVEASTAELIVMADADVWCDAIVDAVTKIAAGAPWAIPHERVRRLTADATQRLYAGQPPTPRDLDEHHLGVPGGGLFVVPRSTFLDIPLDPRFTGWGGEDSAVGWALETLAGRPWRGRTPLLHLWHPPQPRLNRDVGSDAERQLRRRYRLARGHPAAMRQLIEEGRTCSTPQAPADASNAG